MVYIYSLFLLYFDLWVELLMDTHCFPVSHTKNTPQILPMNHFITNNWIRYWGCDVLSEASDVTALLSQAVSEIKSHEFHGVKLCYNYLDRHIVTSITDLLSLTAADSWKFACEHAMSGRCSQSKLLKECINDLSISNKIS